MDLGMFFIVVAAIVVFTAYQLVKWIPIWREGKTWDKKPRTRASRKKNPYSF